MPVPYYTVGDVVCYTAFGGTRRYVRVTHKEADIKNGEAGFDGVTIDLHQTVWGYDRQIVSVDRRNRHLAMI
jgi:hypothetical protein